MPRKWIALVSTALLLVCQDARHSHAVHAGKVPGVGNHLPALEMTDLAGRTHRLGWTLPEPKAAIIFFFEPRSSASLKEMAFLDEVGRLTGGYGLEVFAVEGSGLRPAETREEMQGYRRLYGDPAFPIIPDPAYELSSLFGILRLPTSFLLQRHGVILMRNESFESIVAVDIARKAERILKLKKGHLSPALRENEINAETEAGLESLLRSDAAAAGRAGRAARPVVVGDLIPPFTFRDMSGATEEWSPSAGESELTIVFFWGALCRPCIQEMVFLEEAHTAARGAGLKVIAVEGSGLSPERTRRVMERYQRFYPLPSYVIASDSDYRLAERFGVGARIPQTFFLDSNGEVVYHTDEFIRGHEESLARKIEMALHMEPGTLKRAMAVAEGEDIVLSDEAEAPSVTAAVRTEEEFRSNLVKGDTYYLNWEFDKALPHYLRCLEIEPGRVTLQARVAEIYQRQGRLEEALASWKRVLGLDPENEEALNRIKALGEQGVSGEGAL